MARMNIMATTEAGVSDSLSNPFASMEINDQVNGVNGGVTDLAGGSSALRAKQRVLNEAGVTRVPYSAVLSIVGK